MCVGIATILKQPDELIGKDILGWPVEWARNPAGHFHQARAAGIPPADGRIQAA
jgi:hypothetical protein